MHVTVLAIFQGDERVFNFNRLKHSFDSGSHMPFKYSNMIIVRSHVCAHLLF